MEEHSDDVLLYTQLKAKYIPFFMANISQGDRVKLQRQVDCEDVRFEGWLASCPDLIDRLPSSIL